MPSIEECVAWVVALGMAATILLMPHSYARSAEYYPPEVKIGGTMLSGQITQGSGTHIGDGKILTANHVVSVDMWKTLKVFPEGAPEGRDAKVIWREEEKDLAILQTDPADLASMPIDCEDPKVGTEVSVDGYPFDFGRTTTWGRVATKVNGKGSYLVQMTTMPGQSGSAVRSNGTMVGVMDAMVNGKGGGMRPFAMGMVIAASTVCQTIPR